MQYEQIQTLFEELIDDALDPTVEQNIINQAKDNIESARQWKYLLGLDKSQSVNPGDTYLTPKTLPSDFFTPLESGIYVGTDNIPYQQFPFEDQQFFQSISHGFYIDLANSQYFILGQPNPGGVINFYYQKFTLPLSPLVNGSVAAGTINVPKMPAKFHNMIAYKAAQMYFSIDQGEKARAWDDRWAAFYQEMFDEMVRWDFRVSKQAYANRMMGQRVDMTNYPNVIDM